LDYPTKWLKNIWWLKRLGVKVGRLLLRPGLNIGPFHLDFGEVRVRRL